MPVERIDITDWEDRQLLSVQGSDALTMAGSSDLSIDGDALLGIELSTPDSPKYLTEAVGCVMSEPYMTSIAGALPGPDGEFDLGGDSCLSWKPELGVPVQCHISYLTTDSKGNVICDDSTDISDDDYRKLVNAVKAGTGEQSGIGLKRMYSLNQLSGGIRIMDMCPACSSCSDAALLMKWLEWCKMMTNLLKDVNLYSDTVCAARLGYLRSHRLELPATCTAEMGSDLDRYNKEPELDSVRLLLQYATMVQMWNYAVSQNNSSTEITTAPEDTAGFTVQTRHSIPSCIKHATTISCQIKIIADQMTQTNLSVYVPEPRIYFKPFEIADSGSAVITADSNGTTKTIDVSFPKVEVAGTYFVTVKYLPFIYTVLVNKKGTKISTDMSQMSENAWNITGTTTGTGTETSTTYELEAIKDPTQPLILKNPTSLEYNDAKTYPSHSVPTRNRWKITVSWSVVKGEFSRTWAENFFFETNGVRELVTDIMRQSEWIDAKSNI